MGKGDRQRGNGLFLQDHPVHPGFLVKIVARPVDGEDGCLQELLVRVFLAYSLLVEVEFDKLLDQQRVSGEKVLLRKSGVVDKGFILRN